MKKLYLLMLTMLVAIVANAASVKFTNPDGWTTVNCYAWDGTTNNAAWPGAAMTQDGDVWVAEFDFTPTNVIFNNGSTQTDDLLFEDGATYDLKGVVGAEIPTHTFYFENTDGWSEVYFYSWAGYKSAAHPGELMTEGENNIWSLTIESASVPTGFQFNNGLSGLDERKTPDITKFVEDGTYLPDGTVNGETPVPPTPSDYPTLYVRGISTWDADESTLMTQKDGIYTWSCASIPANTEFKIADAAWGDDQWSSKNMEMAADTEYTCSYASGEGSGMAMAAAVTDAVITFDYNTKTIIVKGDEGTVVDPTPTPAPEKLYIVGTMTGWALDETYMLTKDDNVYTFTFPAAIDNTSEFKIWDGTWAWSFGCGDVVALDEELECWFDGANFTGEALGLDENTIIKDLKVTFTLVDGSAVKDSSKCSYIRLAGTTTGVEAIVADSDVEARFFNLQGVEVANPANGLYIKVAGNKATKVYVK